MNFTLLIDDPDSQTVLHRLNIYACPGTIRAAKLGQTPFF